LNKRRNKQLENLFKESVLPAPAVARSWQGKDWSDFWDIHTKPPSKKQKVTGEARTPKRFAGMFYEQFQNLKEIMHNGDEAEHVKASTDLLESLYTRSIIVFDPDRVPDGKGCRARQHAYGNDVCTFVFDATLFCTLIIPTELLNTPEKGNIIRSKKERKVVDFICYLEQGYEAHLRQWIMGRPELGGMVHEVQNKLLCDHVQYKFGSDSWLLMPPDRPQPEYQAGVSLLRSHFAQFACFVRDTVVGGPERLSAKSSDGIYWGFAHGTIRIPITPLTEVLQGIPAANSDAREGLKIKKYKEKLKGMFELYPSEVTLNRKLVNSAGVLSELTKVIPYQQHNLFFDSKYVTYYFVDGKPVLTGEKRNGLSLSEAELIHKWLDSAPEEEIIRYLKPYALYTYDALRQSLKDVSECERLHMVGKPVLRWGTPVVVEHVTEFDLGGIVTRSIIDVPPESGDLPGTPSFPPIFIDQRFPIAGRPVTMHRNPFAKWIMESPSYTAMMCAQQDCTNMVRVDVKATQTPPVCSEMCSKKVKEAWQKKSKGEWTIGLKPIMPPEPLQPSGAILAYAGLDLSVTDDDRLHELMPFYAPGVKCLGPWEPSINDLPRLMDFWLWPDFRKARLVWRRLLSENDALRISQFNDVVREEVVWMVCERSLTGPLVDDSLALAGNYVVLRNNLELYRDGMKEGLAYGKELSEPGSLDGLFEELNVLPSVYQKYYSHDGIQQDGGERFQLDERGQFRDTGMYMDKQGAVPSARPHLRPGAEIVTHACLHERR
jgi:hypothetical protein